MSAFNMNFENEEFKFALEMIIASRSEKGATLSDIQDDYYMFYGRTFESMFGNCWSLHLRNGLVNTMDNIFTKQLPGGYSLFFTNVAKSNERLQEARKNQNMREVLHRLKLYPQSNGPNRAPYQAPVQNSFSSSSQSSASYSSSNRSSAPSPAVNFYNHSFIADNFFLEISHVDLQLRKTKKNQIERIGLCISGQTMKSAHSTILYSPYTALSANVILNIGTFDLLNGRSAEYMIMDIVRLLNALKQKNIQAIMTTLAPLPNHPDGVLEETRQSFNKFIRENFHYIDIEKCFLSNEKRVLLECYQPNPKPIGGSRHAVTLWNRVGRQRVVQLMKREIPNIHSFF